MIFIARKNNAFYLLTQANYKRNKSARCKTVRPEGGFQPDPRTYSKPKGNFGMASINLKPAARERLGRLDWLSLALFLSPLFAALVLS